jgi:hypothetical protein
MGRRRGTGRNPQAAAADQGDAGWGGFIGRRPRVPGH